MNKSFYDNAVITMNFQAFDFDGKKYMKFKNSYWMLLFHHNHSIAATFDSKEETKHVDVSGKYNILYLLNEEYLTKRHGSLKYEFIINWPNLTYYFQWRQTKNPLDEEEIIGVPKVTGYEEIHVTHNPTGFGGLAADKNRTSVLLNGDIGRAEWYACIGLLKTASSYINSGIPAMYETANVVDLWVKTPFVSFASNCNHQRRLFSKYQTVVIFVLLS